MVLPEWSLSPGGSKTYTYDAAGRTTQVVAPNGTTNIVYDFESRITSLTGPGITQTSVYNGLDTRVSTTVNNSTRAFGRDGVYVTDPVLTHGTDTSFTPGISERRSGTTTFLHSGLKNADAQSSTAQAITATRTYDAFGMIRSSTGTWRGPFGYAGGFGYQEDASGLRLLGHRYYDASTGRFLTRDPIKDGRNWYAYGAGEANPLTCADPTGLIMRGIGRGARIGGFIGLAIGGPKGAAVGAVIGGVIGGATELIARGGGKRGKIAPNPGTVTKPGSSGGPTAGKNFPKRIKDDELNKGRNADGTYTCAYCGGRYKSVEVDHIIPKSKGGNATKDNAQITCQHCNRSKGNRKKPVTLPPHLRK